MGEVYDKLGKRIEPGCIIVYGTLLGRCAALRVGKVVAVKSVGGNPNEWVNGNARITVHGIDDSWANEEPKLNNKKGTLQFSERCLVLDEMMISPKYKRLLETVKI